MSTFVIESSERAPAAARAFAAGVFRERGLGDDHIARLVIDELVTNVHRHTATEMAVVRILTGAAAPVIEVWDRSDEMPVIGAEDFERENGRGLLLMSQLVAAWGTRPLAEGGKVVWARLRAETSE
ncbi:MULTISPECIES: ATP-binding protein [Actinomadura]|uniref:ATP-binding protein n=1 Tax=Actinomadura yumaensis TaxID=111807 RepID=A0ABW2CXJ6_9ACTN|nr:ATP-binding protein [Actinomadura sp. J1-007]MWK34192.1 ATP-binding protein [Actinomadura sp. J1-007]